MQTETLKAESVLITGALHEGSSGTIVASEIIRAVGLAGHGTAME